MMDDGGTDLPSAKQLWKQSLARVTGTPPKLTFSLVGDPVNPAPATYPPQIRGNHCCGPGRWGCITPAGWSRPTRSCSRPRRTTGARARTAVLTGLQGIAYSTNHGSDLTPGQAVSGPPGEPQGWVVRGEGGNYVDGYVYAIATEREFNATNLIMGPSPARRRRHDRPDPVAVGVGLSDGQGHAVAGVLELVGGGRADRQLAWAHHLSADGLRLPAAPLPADLHLLVRARAAGALAQRLRDGDPGRAPPGARSRSSPSAAYFGPSNGYGAGFPISWMSCNGLGRVAQMGRQFRRLRLGPELHRGLRLQLPKGAVHARSPVAGGAARACNTACTATQHTSHPLCRTPRCGRLGADERNLRARRS